MRRDVHCGEPEHEIGEDRTCTGTDNLCSHVWKCITLGQPAKPRVSGSDNGIELGTAYRAQGCDEDEQDPAGGNRILE